MYLFVHLLLSFFNYALNGWVDVDLDSFVMVMMMRDYLVRSCICAALYVLWPGSTIMISRFCIPCPNLLFLWLLRDNYGKNFI